MSAAAVKLANGQSVPAVGLGLWKLPKAAAAARVETAIQVGYRHLDSACDYGNEKEVGEGIRRALSAGSVQRDDLWVTSKLWNTYHAREHVRPACERTLRDLGLDHLDLYL
ncbi:MAG TPA: aldo/keto reductase, partial [Caulifigura sp.]|nr:aldo/keto reductase [Caulifigura sp.]